MTREECEKILKNLMEIAVAVAREYEPQTEYLSLSLTEGSIHGVNEYFNKGKDYKKINFWKEIENEND